MTTTTAPARNPIPRRTALGAVLLLAAVLYGWGLNSGTTNSYYAAAVQAGTHSWKAWFFGSLDAGNFITVDKPPLSTMVQVLSCRVFGFGTWQMLLPMVLAGTGSVAVLYAAVRWVFGTAAGLVAALVLALTPITVAITRDNNPDPLLMLLMVCGAWALLRAVADGRLRWLLLAAVFLGLAFNTKMLQAFLVLPVFAAVYLYAAPGGWWTRLRKVLLSGSALLAVSGSWMLAAALWPSGSRPYIGGSTDNSVWDLVIGYNGLGRIFGAEGRGGGGGGGGFSGASGVGRLFNDILGGQISWLLPLGGLLLAGGLILRGRHGSHPRTDPVRASLLLWGGWTLIHVLVFSAQSGTMHPYYTTALGPGIAALIGGGGVLLFRAARDSARWALLAVGGLGASGVWAIVLLRRTPEFAPWLPWLIGLVLLVACAGLLMGRPLGRLMLPAAVLGLTGILLAPAAYSAETVFGSGGGNMGGVNPTAGPSSAGAVRGGPPGKSGSTGRGGPDGDGTRPDVDGTADQPPSGGRGGPGGKAPGGQPPGGGAASGGGAKPSEGAKPGTGSSRAGSPGGATSAELIAYLKQHQGEATWLLAVGSAQSASSIMLDTGRPVIAMGGFTGTDPAMTVARLQSLVSEGTLHYIMVGGSDRGGPDGGSNRSVTAWVKKHGTAIDAKEYGGTDSTGSEQLYRLG